PSLKCFYPGSTPGKEDNAVVPTVQMGTVPDPQRYSGSSDVMRITKLCLPTCTATSQRAGSSTSCCQRDYCNRSGVAGMRLSYATLGVGILTSFVYLLVWTGL
uniref:Snake toxin/toxin-like domain-containing protein n=1 Tax=Pelusios castaneus TaxID=367368 RepID=A0A8C8RHP4_9SAUR